MKKLQAVNINSPEFFDKAYFGRLKEHNLDFCEVDKKRYIRLAEKFARGNFLDLGAGDSPLGVYLSERIIYAKYFALDFAEGIIEYLNNKYPQVEYTCGNVLDTPYKDKYFDYIVMGELLEHMNSPQNLIKEAMRILKPKGMLALSTPYKEDLTKEKFISPEHMWSFDRQDIRDLLGAYGEVKVEIYKKERHPKILAWCRKNAK